MTKLFKKLVLCTIAVATVLALASCGKKTKKEGSINVWWPGGSETVLAGINRAKERYEEANPGVTINIKPQSTNDFYAQYTMALMGKEIPDVAYVDHVFVQRLAFDYLTTDLTSLGLDSCKSSYIDSLINPNMYEGHLYGLPMSANVLCLVYNKALLTTVYGREFTNEDLPKNWDEYIAIGEKIAKYNSDHSLTAENDKFFLTTVPTGTGAESMGSMYFLSSSARNGGTIMNSDLTEMTFATSQNIDSAEKIKYLADNGYTTRTWNESKFETGKVAFIEMGPWKLIEYSRISESVEACDYGYTTVIPYQNGGDISSTLGLYSLVISRKSQNKELAADFIKFLTTDKEIQLLHNTAQNLMPVTKEAIQDDFYKTPEWEVYKEQLNHVVARCGSAIWPAIEKQIAEFMTGLVNGTRQVDYIYSVQAALTDSLEDMEEE